jgi:hypothetical protein
MAGVINTAIGIVERFLSMGGIVTVVLLCSLFYRFRAPIKISGVATEQQACELLDEAIKLEAGGDLSEALAKYQEGITGCGRTTASKDAEQCIESLREKIRQNENA